MNYNEMKFEQMMINEIFTCLDTLSRAGREFKFILHVVSKRKTGSILAIKNVAGESQITGTPDDCLAWIQAGIKGIEAGISAK